MCGGVNVEDFSTFLRNIGLKPGQIVQDGRWRRCSTDDKPTKRNGSYKLAADGEVGWAQNFATHESPVTWWRDSNEKQPDARPIDIARIRHEARKLEAKRNRASQAAKAFYGQCAPLIGGHPYLSSHGLDMRGCKGLRLDAEGWLVVPMGSGTRFMSIQRISVDGEKKFWPGAPVSGARYIVNGRPHQITIVTEGLATALAIYASVPNCRVVVAFNAGNLPKIAAQIDRRGLAVVAADNDHETEAKTGTNPGVKYATEAAEILGCGVAYPQGIAGTDWADAREEWYQERVAQRGYGKRTNDLGDRQAADARVKMAIMSGVRYLTEAG